MKYHELLELYKKNALNGELLERVKNDIERQEAISEYLFEQAEKKDDYDTAFETDIVSEGEIVIEKVVNRNKTDEKVMRDAVSFTRQINRSIRRAFLKLGIVTGISAVLLTLFVMMILPKIVDCFYYNPGDNGEQMSLDMSVYTETTMPGYFRDNIVTDSKGYGEYDVYIYQNVSYNSKFTNVAGKLEKGKLTLYDPNALRRPTGNAFAWFQMEGDSRDSLTQLIDEEGQMNHCASGKREESIEYLQNLDDGEKYVAYVTLDKMMRYEDFMKYLQESEAYDTLANLWCAVCTENGIDDIDTSENGVVGEDGSVRMSFFRAENLGFSCDLTSSTALKWDKEKYPSLLLWDEYVIENNLDKELREKMLTEEFMQEHFVSMLRYLSDQEEFMTMMNENPEAYKNAAEYVEEKGLMVYGYAGIGRKEHLLALIEEPEVYQIYTQELR